jgi:hypothetical protein
MAVIVRASKQQSPIHRAVSLPTSTKAHISRPHFSHRGGYGPRIKRLVAMRVMRFTNLSLDIAFLHVLFGLVLIGRHFFIDGDAGQYADKRGEIGG